MYARRRPALLAAGPQLAVAALTALAVLVTAVAVQRLGPLALALAGAGLAAVLALGRPTVVLGAYLALAVLFEQGEAGLLAVPRLYEPIAAGVAPLDLLLGLSVGAVGIDCLRRRRVPELPAAMVAGLGLLVAGLAAGSVTAAFAGVAFTEIYDNVFGVLPLLLVPLLVAAALDTPERLEGALRFAAVLIAFKAALGVAGVLAGFTTPDPALGSDGGGARLTYYEPTVNFLCLAMLLMGVVALLRRADVSRMLLWALPIVAGSLVLSYRRSFWIATVFALLLVLLFGLNRLQRHLAVPTLLVTVLAAWAMFSAGALGERLGGSVIERARSLQPSRIVANREDRYRLDERANVVAEIRRAPVTGLGFGVPWTARQPLPVEHGRDYAHTAILWFWLKLGILGAIAYAVLLGSGAVAALRVGRAHPRPAMAALGLALFGSLVGLALVETTATFTGADTRFSIVLGAALGLVARLRADVA